MYMHEDMVIHIYAHRHSGVPARRTRVIDTAALVSGRFLDDKKHRWLGFEKAQKLALDTEETGTLRRLAGCWLVGFLPHPQSLETTLAESALAVSI